MKITVAILVLAGAQALATAHRPATAAQDAPAKTVWSGVYTDAQAKRGGDVYTNQCVSCHAPDLTGLDQAPPLTGSDFNTNWNDLSLNDLFERIRISMPGDKPGSLDRQQVADVLAFVLSKGSFPTGDAELPVDNETLKTIKFLAAKP